LRPSSIGMLVYQSVPRFWKPSPSFSSMIFQPATFDYQKVMLYSSYDSSTWNPVQNPMKIMGIQVCGTS
jgi:hypothetical protein